MTKNPNEIQYRDGYAVMLLKHKGQPLECLMDVADVSLAESMQVRWVANWNPLSRTFYCVCTIRADRRRVRVWLHRLLMQAPSNLMVDHHDHDGLNNRRENLRIATRSQNQRNRRRPQGVLRNRQGTWFCRSRYCGKEIYTGVFPTPEGACRAMHELVGKLPIEEQRFFNLPTIDAANL